MQMIHTNCVDIPDFEDVMDDPAVQRAFEEANRACWRLTMAIVESALEMGGDLMCVPSDTGLCETTFAVGNETSNAHLGRLHRSSSRDQEPCEWPMCWVESLFYGE